MFSLDSPHDLARSLTGSQLFKCLSSVRSFDQTNRSLEVATPVTTYTRPTSHLVTTAIVLQLLLPMTLANCQKKPGVTATVMATVVVTSGATLVVTTRMAPARAPVTATVVTTLGYLRSLERPMEVRQRSYTGLFIYSVTLRDVALVLPERIA